MARGNIMSSNIGYSIQLIQIQRRLYTVILRRRKNTFNTLYAFYSVQCRLGIGTLKNGICFIYSVMKTVKTMATKYNNPSTNCIAPQCSTSAAVKGGGSEG